MRSWDEGSTVMIPETMIMPDSTATSPLHAWQSPSVACLSPACRLPHLPRDCRRHRRPRSRPLVVEVDSDGKIVATDETVAVITPEGDTVIDEKLSVLGDDGELHTVEEDISVTEVDE